MKYLTIACLFVGGVLWAQVETAAPKSEDMVRAVLDRAERALGRGAAAEAMAAAGEVIAADARNVRAFLIRAQAFQELRQHERAVADFTEILKIEPRAPTVYQQRGFEHFKLGRIPEALADFDRFLEFVPTRGPHHWQRGIALYYAGRFDEGRRQFESHQTVNQNDVENAVWHYLCVAREHGVDRARASLIDIKGDGRIPMKEIYALFAGTGKPQEVLVAAEDAPRSPADLKNRLFYAHLYLGLYHEAAGNAGLAEDHIAKAAGPYAQDHYMGDVARVHRQLRSAKSPR